MPARRNSYKKRRRPYSRKKRRYSRKKRFTRKGGSFIDLRRRAPFPIKKAVLQRFIPANCYVLGDGSTNPNNLLPVQHVFSANGIYDPDVVSTFNHQPMGFDEMIQYYNHYCVVGAQIKVIFENAAESPQNVWIHVSDGTAKRTDIRRLFEGGNTKWATLGTISRTKTLTYRINPNKFLGITKPLSSSLVRGTPTTNPDEGVFFHIGAAAQEVSQPTGKVFANVIIEYNVVWTEPKPLGISLMGAEEPHVDSEPAPFADHTHTYTDHDDIAHGTGTPNVTETSTMNTV